MAVVDARLYDPAGSSHHKRRPSSPAASTSLNHVHIAEALLNSSDEGATLDFSHKALTDVGEYGAEELATIGREDLMNDDESSVLRITLASNRLATLPMAFALLSRLRYLNLKNNSLSVFPDVLTVMPSLEILDIGRNKIKRLPSQPGSLINLEVFSFYKNKIARLPPYIAQFTRLTYLRAEQNPIEWPPKIVMDSQSSSMEDWIRALQRWIEDNSASRGHSADPPGEDRRIDAEIMSPIPGQDSDDGKTPHARSFSVSSDVSVNDIFRHASTFSFRQAERPSPLHLGSLPPPVASGSSISISNSPDTYLPTPDESVSSYTDDEESQDPSDSTMHARNASYAGSTRVALRSSITGKKSLPDLRPARLQLGGSAQGRPSPGLPPWGQAGTPLQASKSMDQFTILSPLSNRQDSSGSTDSTSLISSTPARPFARENGNPSPTTATRPAPSMDRESKSYFRRFSTLPTTSKTIPESLLHLVDAVRGILFAVSQIYTTLQHYTVYAIDERLAAVLRKVLDPASTYMTQLINALDRFDSACHRTIPAPVVCRAVVESCKDNVAVFGKAVGVLALQLKVLATRDDVRRTRQMLLVLYGASAEISNAWQSIVPHIAAVQPFLRDHPPRASKARPGAVSLPSPAGSSSVPSSASPAAPSFAPLRLPTFDGPLSAGRTHIARRHAGSFSYKDVEIGASLPFDEEPLVQGGVVFSHAQDTPTPRAALRQAGFFSPSPGGPFSAMMSPGRSFRKGSVSPREAHSRQGSQSSLIASSTTSPFTSAQPPIIDAPQDYSTLVDKEAIDAMTKAVEVASPVWAMMKTMTADIPEQPTEMLEALERAQGITQQLKEGLEALQDGSVVDRKSLREDAHLFVKVVVQLSNNIKLYGASHPMSSALRTNMVKLTNATEEFVILLHVSSFSATTTARSYTPMVNGFSSNAATAPVDDGRLGANLSRSRSALAAASRRLASPLQRDMPHSALPHQTFKVTSPPPRLTRGMTDDALDVF